MMSRHPRSHVYRVRPNHGVAFLDIEISMSELSRVKACFVEERLPSDGGERTVLLPVGSDNMFNDGTAWHPETFQPLGRDEAIWLSGHAGIAPFIGHWLPLPYLRVMIAKSVDGVSVDQGPLNWVRIFISAPDGPLDEASVLKAVLAIDTQLAANSRLDQRRYNAPSLEDVSLGSTFVLTDDAEQLGPLLTEPWLNGWLRETLAVSQGSFEQGHVARYLFLLKALSEACPAPILRFANQSRERIAIESIANEFILDLSDDVGLAVLVGQQPGEEWSPETGRSRVLKIRDLGRPANVHSGALPIRVEFDGAPFGLPNISRQSGRSNAFNWPSLVRIGVEAERIAMRANAATGATGSASLVRNVHDSAPIAGVWRNSSDNGGLGISGPPARNRAMRYLAENGDFIGDGCDAAPALRPRFSKSSLLTLFVAELVLHAISALNEPQLTGPREAVMTPPEVLRTLRLSLPVSIDATERAVIIARATEGIDFVWRAQGWDDDATGQSPPKPAVVLGIGGDFGVQLIHLHGQLNDVYGGDLVALVEDLAPVRRPAGTAQQVVQFASIALGFTATRVVIADYSMIDSGSIRPRLVAAETMPWGLDAIHEAIIDRYLKPAIAGALRASGALLAADSEPEWLAFQPGDLAQRLRDKVLMPAARALLGIYADSPSGVARGVELLTVAGLVERGGGHLEPFADLVDREAQALGADGFRITDVTVAFSRHAFRKVVIGELEIMLGAATSVIDVGQTDLVFVTSTYAATDDLRDLILSLVPISPHRLAILDEQWGAEQDKFAQNLRLPGGIAVSARIGVLSTIIGQRRMLDYEGLASIEPNLQLETEVA